MMLTAAQYYVQKGFSVIPTGESKRSLFPWKPYQSALPSELDLEREFSSPNAAGLAVICGAVSGNLEVIDVDLKYDLSGDLWERFTEAIHQVLPLLYIVKTKSGGYHLYYKCEVIAGNQKLAMRNATPEELAINPNTKEVVLIETRGEAGYVIAPPTPGYEKQNDFNVQVISLDQRDIILTAARSFNDVVAEERAVPRGTQAVANGMKTSPWDDYNTRCDVIALLERHGWTFVRERGGRSFVKRPNFPPTDSETSGDYHHEKGFFKVFSSSTPFELNKGYRPFSVYAILEHNGDHTAAARALIDLGYGEQKAAGPITKKVLQAMGNGLTPVEISSTLVSENGIEEEEAGALVKKLEKQQGPTILTFWEVKWTKSKGDFPVILRYKLIEYLYTEGFHLYFYDRKAAYRIVQQKNGLVTDANTETIKKHIKDYITSLPERFDGISRDELLELVLKGSDIYFGKGLLEFLNTKNLDILRDDEKCAYFTFSNGIVKVTEDSVTMHTYAELGKAVWASHVIDFPIDIEQEFDPQATEFYDFLNCISADAENGQEKAAYLTSLVGYLLHRYKDPSRPYAVILAEQTEDEKKGGGTGKGLLVTALQRMANTTRVDGKNFKLDKSFAFQRVDLDTKIVAIEDVRKNVDFEGFYSIITEGMTIEKKNKDEYFIPYKDSPKVLFTTNYTIAASGGHGQRRQRMFEFSNYFSNHYTPVHKYGHRLFDDWDADEWNRFYNLMFLCVQDYLLHGVRSIDRSAEMTRKHIRLAYTQEFLEWWDGYLLDNVNVWREFKSLYAGFLENNNFERKEYSQKRLRSAFETAAEAFGYRFETRRSGMAKVVEYRIASSQKPGHDENASHNNLSDEPGPF